MAMVKTPGTQPRIVAARILDAVLHDGRSLRLELEQGLPALRDPRDRALAEAICYAVLRQPNRYKAALEAWMPKPLPRRDNPLRALLYVGLAQLDGLGLAPHAAVAATVEAARGLGRQHQAALVNALLRRAQREGLPDVAVDAHWPAWLRERIASDWPRQAEAILAASQAMPPLWLRVNRQRVTREAYLDRLQAAGLAQGVELPASLPDAMRLETSLAVSQLPGFAEGLVSIQDAAAQRVADALAPPTGGRVLDACAAPGGKTAHLLERDPTLGVTAVDVDPQRLESVRAGLMRLQVGRNARLVDADAADPSSWWDGEVFDAILLDAPCSATGILRRQPDVLLHRRESDVARLVDLQARLLDALWPTLARGGALLYATCSILRAENADQVAAFLARTPDAALEPLDDSYGHAGRTDLPGSRQRLPGEEGMDGFFYARLRKAGARLPSGPRS